MLLLLTACSFGDSRSSPTVPIATPVALGCIQVCTVRCQDLVDTGMVCLDSGTSWSFCFDEGYVMCEVQPDQTCGWTMLDQAGWDACVADATQ